MGKTWTLRTIREAIDPEKDVVVVEKEYVAILSFEPPNRLKMIFKKAGHRYVQINLTEAVELIVSKLAPHIDIKRFLSELILLHSSLEKTYVKITGKKLCYSLLIGGKRGKPYEFNLVDKMAEKTIAKFGIICPKCEALIILTGTVEEAPEIKRDVKESDVLAVFPPSLRKSLKVKVSGNIAKVELKGKYDSKKFRKAMTEVRGYGGRWIKGHFVLPIPRLMEE